MDREMIAMIHKVLDQVCMIRKGIDRELIQREASLQLGLRERQIKRLVGAFRTEGAVSLVSGHCGRPSNNRVTVSAQDYFIGLVPSHDHDFDSTLANKKLG